MSVWCYDLGILFFKPALMYPVRWLFHHLWIIRVVLLIFLCLFLLVLLMEVKGHAQPPTPGWWGDPLSRFRTVVQHRCELSYGVEPKLSTLRTFCLISDRTGCCALPPGWMETENQQHLSLSLDMLEKTPPISFTSVFKCVIEVHGLLSWHENMISTVQLQN